MPMTMARKHSAPTSDTAPAQTAPASSNDYCKVVRHSWNAADMGDEYMSLEQGGSISTRGLEDCGWAFGEAFDRSGNLKARGWFPAAYVEFYKVARFDWDSSGHGYEYLPLRKGDHLWHKGVIEEGWAYGELCDECGVIGKQGWYPPEYVVAGTVLPEEHAETAGDEDKEVVPTPQHTPMIRPYYFSVDIGRPDGAPVGISTRCAQDGEGLEITGVRERSLALAWNARCRRARTA